MGGCGPTTLAWASPCMQDQYGRPIAGTVNVCPIMFEASERRWKQDVIILTHETAHILIMAPELWDDFRDLNGDLVGHEKVVSEPQENGLIYITSPGVAEWSKSHFGCDSLIGFPLENTGSGLSASAHWDERHAMSSLMGSTIWGSLHYVTNATFWLMQDSGWYNVDFSGVEEWHWGSGTGCSWFETDCMEKGSNAANWPQFFCSSRTDNGCSANYEAPAFCEYYLYRNDLPVGQQYFSDNPNGGGPAAADYCPFRDPSSDHHHVEGSCRVSSDYIKEFDPRNPLDTLPGETYGVNSRCVDVIESIESDGSTNANGHCVEHECMGYDADLQQWSDVLISVTDHHDDQITCTREDSPFGQQVTLKYIPSIDAYMRCPDIDAICGSTSRPFACLWGHWSDLHSQCICSPGYIGEFCDIEDREHSAELPVSSDSTGSGSTIVADLEIISTTTMVPQNVSDLNATTGSVATSKDIVGGQGICCECLEGRWESGCSVDTECQHVVCQRDPLCCLFNWASPCVVLANEQCASTGGDPPPCCGCVTQRDEGGCREDERCEDAICSRFPICCGRQWDQKCAELAIPICMNGN